MSAMTTFHKNYIVENKFKQEFLFYMHGGHEHEKLQ